MIGSRVKDPLAIRTYSIDWSAFLTSLANDTIASSVWTVPAGLVLVAQSSTTTKTNVRISSGVVGKTYTITNTITTASGEVQPRSFQLVVQLE